MSYNIVNCFLKDSRGMLWVGTYNGLNKYDGAHFYTYHSGNSSNTLPNNTVHKLAEDKKGNIWGSTDYGAFCFDTKTGNFKGYQVPKKQSSISIYNILCDQQGKVWAANNNNLFLLNEAKGVFELDRKQDSNVVMRIRKNGFVESPDGKGFWLASHTGIYYYDKAKKEFTSAANSTDTILFNKHSVSSLSKTAYGHYWFSDNEAKAIIGFDPITKKVKYNISLKGIGQGAYGATLFEDSRHMLWYCTWGYEIFMIDYLHGNVVTRLQHDKNDITSIAGDFFWDVMEEADGTIWFGTVGGISKCNPTRAFYKVHHLPAAAHTEVNPSTVLMNENPLDSTWWFVTSKNVLVHYDPATTKSELFDLFKFSVNSNNKRPEYNHRILFYKDSVMLFSYTGAWVKKGKGDFKPLVLKPPFNNWILKDADLYNGHLLYVTDFRRLLKWDLQTGQMDSMAITKPVLINGDTSRLYIPVVNKKGKVWMTNGYDWLTYSDKNELRQVKIHYQSDTEEDVGYFSDMIVDSKGVLWFAKKGDGIIYYNPSTNECRQLKQHDGLVMDHVMAVAEDGNGKIWSGAYNQFSVYNPLLNSFYNFTLPISANNYAYTNLMTALHNGNIIANVGGDIVEFYTNRLKPPQVKDKPLISLLSVNGADTNGYDINILNLQPKENSLRLKFGMLTDNASTPYDMLYILEGAEKKWTASSTSFEAAYNSLPPGDYTFKVKALAKDKSWQTAETILKIHIATPFYKAWWFFTLLGVITLATVIIIYRLRMAQKERLMLLESKAQLLEKEKTHVMYENLKQHLNPHFLFNSLTSLSSLIRIDQKQAGNFLDKMSKVYRYILKNRDNETVPLLEEIKFVKLYNELQKTRFGEGLEINMNIDEEHYHRKIAPVTLQNLVENAIKHNTADIDSPLVIDLFVKDDYLVVKNNLQKKTFVETSNKQGLGNMQSLYRFLSDREMTVEEKDDCFVVKVPLI